MSELSFADFSKRLRRGLGVQIGPFAARLTVQPTHVHATLYALYGDFPLLPDDRTFSFHARIRSIRSAGGIGRRKIRFDIDGQTPHEDMPFEQSLAVLEWGLNLVIALRMHCFFMIHGAVVEKNGIGVVLPAQPGSGKTTLSAGLALNDWRLLSDEFCLIRVHSDEITAIPRPLVLKNESIQVIRDMAPSHFLGPSIENTRKGTVAHLKPPGRSVSNASSNATTDFVLFPKWRQGSEIVFAEVSGADAFSAIALNSFNYELHGEFAFETVCSMVNNANCYSFEYGDLDGAIDAIEDFIGSHGD